MKSQANFRQLPGGHPCQAGAQHAAPLRGM